jgi:hypothetical protein
MSNLKDNDLDDLFRRASDKYPLRTDSSDWDRMAAALEKDRHSGQTDGLDSPDSRRSRRFLWLLLLLPLAGAGYYAVRLTGSHNQGKTAVASAAATPEPAATRSATATDAGSTGPVLATALKDGKPTTPNRLSSVTYGLRTGSPGSGKPAPAGRSSQPNGRRLTANLPTFNSQPTDNLRSFVHPGTRGGLSPAPAADLAETPADRQNSPGPDGLPYNWIDPERVHTAGNYHLTVDVKAPPKATAAKQQASPAARSSFLYAGVIVAPDLSMVKMQSVKGVGSTFGILLGYAFDKRWSVETGAYLDRKKYYTSGEYFNTKEVVVPSNSEVNGSCNMWEIPLNVRYNFNPEGRLHWFATAGLSTYLMRGEKYTYTYQYNGWGLDSAWNTKKPSQYPFSVVNLSVGLEQRLGKIGFLRIEPYARVPLTGMGAGKLPIMSTGINIGFVRPLWK